MKCFVLAILILGLITSAITLNCLYINKVSNSLLSLIERAIYEGIDGETNHITKINEEWTKTRKILSMSVSFIELDKIDTQLIVAKNAYDTGDAIEYERYMKLLKASFENLKRLEKLSVFNILYIKRKERQHLPFLYIIVFFYTYICLQECTPHISVISQYIHHVQTALCDDRNRFARRVQ